MPNNAVGRADARVRYWENSFSPFGRARFYGLHQQSSGERKPEQSGPAVYLSAKIDFVQSGRSKLLELYSDGPRMTRTESEYFRRVGEAPRDDEIRVGFISLSRRGKN